VIFTQHQIHKAPEILGRDPAGNVLVRFDDGVRRMTPDQLVEFHKLFEERIRLEIEDPYRYGAVLPVWSTADRQSASVTEPRDYGHLRAWPLSTAN
jgi:hypothetical protein